jgi:hypothetical protein
MERLGRMRQRTLKQIARPESVTVTQSLQRNTGIFRPSSLQAAVIDDDDELREFERTHCALKEVQVASERGTFPSW